MTKTLHSILISFLICSISVQFSLFAQLSEMRIVGTPKEEPAELIGKDNRDANGVVCAGLIIYSDLVGLSYQANNGVVKVNKEQGKDLLFLSPDEKMVEVYCKGYSPLKIILNEVGIRLKSGQTWSLKFTGDKKLDLLPVTFQIQPTDASLWIDGNDKAIARTVQLSIGEHTVRVSKEGFNTEEKKITVSTANVFFSLSLKEIEPVKVKIRSVPSGAQFFIDNASKGETDKDLFLFPGEYSFKLIKNGYVDVVKKITVTETSSNLFSTPLEKNSSTIMLSITPSDARVLINKEDYSNKTSIELAPGRYKIEVNKLGYNDQSETIDLALGGKINKQFTLIAKTGTLQFTVQPVYAHVQLMSGGSVAYSWEGSKIQKGIQVGEYDLVCDASGYRTIKKTVSIAESKTVVEDIVMQQGVSSGSASSGDFIFVRGGTFQMGTVENDVDDEFTPIHSVILSDFYIGKYEVTQKQWLDVMGNNPSKFKGDSLPVEQVNWTEIQEFISKLNLRGGNNIYRLPTEAEWEYAARGGNKSSKSKYAGSNILGNVAWYYSNSDSKTHDVGTKKPNELGIYDMSGNVMELCNDWFDKNYYKKSPKQNPQGPNDGSSRVLRGGSFDRGIVWEPIGRDCNITRRDNYFPDNRENYIGFRLLRTK